MSRTRDLIVAAAREAGYAVPEDAQVTRSHVGHWQRSQGAWLWTLDYDRWPRDARGYRRATPTLSPYAEQWDRLPVIGSGWQASALVRCRHLTLDPVEHGAPEVEVNPCEVCRPKVAAALR